MSDITYKFTNPLKYSDTIIFSQVILHEPTILHLPLVSKIKESYNIANMDMLKRFISAGGKLPESSNSGVGKTVTKEDTLTAIKSTLDGACAGTTDLYENVRALFLSDGICMLQENGTLKPSKMQEGFLNKIGLRDFTAMCVEYLAAFIVPAS